MTKYRELSDSEMEIMEFIWKRGRSVTMREIWTYTSEKLSKSWMQQTIRAFLLRLEKKGFIKISTDIKLHRQIFTAVISKQEYLHKITENVLTKFFNGSLAEFAAAFTGGSTLDEEETNSLKEILNN